MRRMMGFTIIEVVVVVGIIGIIIAIGTDLFANVIKTSNKATVVNQLKQNVSSAMDELERSIRAGYSMPAQEMTLSGNRAYITVVNADRATAVRYRICLRHPTEDRCLATSDVEGTSESCPSLQNCVGHIRKYSCTRVGSTESYTCTTSLGVLTNVDRVTGADLVTASDASGGSSKYSRFTVYPGTTGATVTLSLYALQGPDAPSRGDYKVCEATDIANCGGLVELTTTTVMRQR